MMNLIFAANENGLGEIICNSVKARGMPRTVTATTTLKYNLASVWK